MAFTAAFGIGAAPKDGALMTLMLMDRVQMTFGAKAEKWLQHCLQLAVRVQDCPNIPRSSREEISRHEMHMIILAKRC